MKRSELKAMIKECVKEALFEEGVLSEIIAEVAFGLTKAQSVMLEQQAPQKPNPQIQQKLNEEREEEHRKKLLETKRKMLTTSMKKMDLQNKICQSVDPSNDLTIRPPKLKLIAPKKTSKGPGKFLIKFIKSEKYNSEFLNYIT